MACKNQRITDQNSEGLSRSWQTAEGSGHMRAASPGSSGTGNTGNTVENHRPGSALRQRTTQLKNSTHVSLIQKGGPFLDKDEQFSKTSPSFKELACSAGPRNSAQRTETSYTSNPGQGCSGSDLYPVPIRLCLS